ncbi:MAG: hypothetical protein A2W09_07425 [Deltaproteobacteria bacterium RBG_16_50_11]|nr:MAG: hypothetical protein A2W09_07425 [Deltaproteobacteria bacterium RBG_16_50_11]
MARIILGSYMVRYPLGGNLSWALQWLIGFQQLGHDIYFVEKSGYSEACFDPVRGIMSDDCSYGIKTISTLLERFDLQNRWCFVDAEGIYYGISRRDVESIFKAADMFIDMGTHGSWLEEAANVGLRVLVEAEPGYTQMKMEKKLDHGESLPEYDYYYTIGQNIGTARSSAPTAGCSWRPVFNPVVLDLFPLRPVGKNAPFTTVMNWQAHEPIQFRGNTYGQKDMEFNKFLNLPHLTDIPLEIAVAGKQTPKDHLIDYGWRVRDAIEVTLSFDSFREYIQKSKGEFSVCKNVFFATKSGWFSDRSAAYLASGRPVVAQETGFSFHLPCGHGLFAVETVNEARDAIVEIITNYERHSSWARELAFEYLEARKVLKRFLGELDA